MTTGNKIPMSGGGGAVPGGPYNHMFNKTVRSGNGNEGQQFYGDVGMPPTSAGASQHMLVNYSIKGLG